MTGPRTVFIWLSKDKHEIPHIKFFTLDGDYRKFQQVYIGLHHPDMSATQRTQDYKMQDELHTLVLDTEGKPKVALLNVFPTVDVIQGAHVITCGCVEQ